MDVQVLLYCAHFFVFFSEIECPSPPMSSNSKINITKPTYIYKDIITIVCNTGYTLQGESELTCQADTTWNHFVPTCNGKL